VFERNPGGDAKDMIKKAMWRENGKMEITITINCPHYPITGIKKMEKTYCSKLPLQRRWQTIHRRA
jgi:hypothetical protein